MKLIDKGLYEKAGFAYYPVLAISSVLIIFIGIALSYVVALIVFSLLRRRKPMQKITAHPPKPSVAGPIGLTPEADPLARYNSIGIILAGGGAKGAYQAGAMQAIYEFLDRHHAHHKVKMIAGTSIGSWNALFWLSHLIKNPDGGQGLLEQWWNKVNIEDIIAPTPYWPFLQNYLLSNQPWQQTFKNFFIDNKEVHDQLLYHIQHPDESNAIHFYFTRTNVTLARLEFVTNVRDFKDVENEYLLGTSLSDIKKMNHRATSVEAMGEAVFSSMDFPPLFPYMSVDEHCYEDGGVIDNLPIRFGTDVEKCDLLFVLPLNASFAEEPNPRSILKRLLRVMNVRQGVLERNAFKRVYRRNELMKLSNEIVDLRNQLNKLDEYENLIERLQQRVKELSPEFGNALAPIQTILDEAIAHNHIKRKEADIAQDACEVNDSVRKLIGCRNNRVQVFSICPASKLAIGTNEFWKTSEAGQAFRHMYKATSQALESFDFASEPDRIRIAHVQPLGQILWLEDI